MRKLIVFGDSYADRIHNECLTDDNKDLDYPIWYDILAQSLGYKLLKYGLCGSSIEYSMIKLYEYINSFEYSENDVIVFVCSSTVRIPLIHKNIPPSTASSWIKYIDGSLKHDKRIKRFFDKHGNFFKTLFKFYNLDLAHQQRSNIAFLLKSLPNQTLIVSAFDDVDYALSDSRKHLLKNDENFILINGNLLEISNREIEQDKAGLEFLKFFNHEIRHAHLTRTNNQILAKQLYNCIVHNTPKFFDPSEFKTNIIRLSHDYDNIKTLEHETLYLLAS